MKPYGMLVTFGADRGIAVPKNPFWRFSYVPVAADDGWEEFIFAYSTLDPKTTLKGAHPDDLVTLTNKGLDYAVNGKLGDLPEKRKLWQPGELPAEGEVAARQKFMKDRMRNVLYPHETLDGVVEPKEGAYLLNVPGRTREPELYGDARIEKLTMGDEEVTIDYAGKKRVILISVGADDEFRRVHPELAQAELFHVDVHGYWITGTTNITRVTKKESGGRKLQTS